jgi:hypothetical protein
LLDENQIMPYYIHHSNDIGKASISPATILLQKCLWHFLDHQKFISTQGVMLLVAVNAIFTGFYHEHFSVLLRKGKDWYVLFIFVFSLMWYIFFTELARSPSMRRVTSTTNVLLYPYLRDTRSSGFHPFYAATQFVLTSLTSYWTTSVIASVHYNTPVVIHHSIMPRYPTSDLFCLIFN